MHNRISAIVEQSGLTKTAFAKKINVSQGLISQLCSGFTNPSDRTISDICREFGISEEWIRTGEGPMRKSLSRQAEIARFVGEVMNDAKKQDAQRVLAALMDTSPEELEALVNFARRLAAQYKEKDRP